ncbi:uncharacterized protein [Henckelia pumila]|uniref:uncharacterized protein n=1 Tax=Henckelia pumila TaxID=405737 RepID=UPI003C6DBC31
MAVLCWSIWMDRNQLVFKGKAQLLDTVLARAFGVRSLTPFLSITRSSNVVHPLPASTWQPPSVGTLKVNVDAAMNEMQNYFSVRLVGRDNNVKERVSRAIHMGWNDWMVESDALSMIQVLKTPTPFSLDAPIYEEVRRLCSNNHVKVIRYNPRKTNMAAHVTAKHCFQSEISSLWMEVIPW